VLQLHVKILRASGVVLLARGWHMGVEGVFERGAWCGWDSGANDDDGSTKSSYHFMNNAGIC